MKQSIVLCLAVLSICSATTPGHAGEIGSKSNAAGAASVSSEPIPSTLFGMTVHIRGQKEPWPVVPFGSFRVHDRLASWALINKSDGNYDWRQLDGLLADLKAHGVDDVVFTLNFTPSWASSRPNENCAQGQAKALVGLGMLGGACDPPNDVNPDGTGTDKHWKDFITAIAKHSKNSSTAHIKYWEIWNEPHNDFFWTGTFPQMVRMAHDAYTIIKGIDPDALVLTPSVGLDPGKSQKWIEGYLAAGGGQYADVIAFHGYVHSGRFGVYPQAADLVPRLNNFKNVLAKYGQSDKPLWDTEASWGNASVMGFENDEDFQAAFLGQFYLLHWSEGVARLYWYAYNDGTVGTLWRPDPGNPSGPGKATKGAQAYTQVYKWLVGSTMTKPCSQRGNLWTCSLTKADGHEMEVTWASHGEQTYKPKPSFTKTRDLEGNTATADREIKVSSKPILLESQ